MKLGSLVYEVVKDAIEFPSGFNKEGFIRGDYDEDRDFNSQISFAFNYINLAFARLLSEKKTLLKYSTAISDPAGFIPFQSGEITSVFYGNGCDYKYVGHKPFTNGIVVEGRYVQKQIHIEYRASIPHFSLEDIRSQEIENGETYYEEVEIELSDYGITDEMCSYVKEYAKGGLTEYLSPDLSQKHLQMAEKYFSDLKTIYTEHPQREIEDRLGGGGAW